MTESSDETITVRGAPVPDRTPLSERMRRRIRSRIRAFVAEKKKDPLRLRVAARALDLLPLQADGERWLGVRPNADVVSFSPHPPHAERVEEDLWCRAAALSRGSERYPELAQIVPPAPPSCRVCPRCFGSGRIRPHIIEPAESREEGQADKICVCGGLGWLPPIADEPTREHTPRRQD